jgi:hypothetical protein
MYLPCTVLCVLFFYKKPERSVYKCTEAGINSHITVPSKVCASQVFTKLLQRVKFSSDQIKLSEKVSLERDRALCSFSHGPH